jgi:hypothetical protein
MFLFHHIEALGRHVEVLDLKLFDAIAKGPIHLP